MNEFIIKNGFRSQGNSEVTGSLNVTAGITGSLLGTASFATVASNATSISSAITNDINNCVLTATGTGTINGETNLLFNGSVLTLAGPLSQSLGGLADGTFSQAQGRDVLAMGPYSHAEGSGSATFTKTLYSVNAITAGVIVMNQDLTTVFEAGDRLYYNSDASYPDNTSFIVSSSIWNGSTTTITLTNTSITDIKPVFGSLDYPYSSWAGGFTSTATAGHAEGFYTTAVADWSHAEGFQTQTFGRYSHAEGTQTQANGTNSHAEGGDTKTFGEYSHAEGRLSQTTGIGSHAEGYSTIASGSFSHAEGQSTTASGNYSHAEGKGTTAVGDNSHAEGNGTTSTGNYSHAEGNGTTATGNYSHAEGTGTTAVGDNSHAEGAGTTSTGNYSHAEGNGTTASGPSSHAEGNSTTASGPSSHAEGNSTTATGDSSHAEGKYTTTGNTSGYYATMTASGVFTISSSYGDVSTAGLFNAGYIIGVDDSQYDNSYTYVNLVVASCSFNGTNTLIYVTDTSFITTTAIIGSISNFGNGGDRAWGGYGAHAQGNYTTALGSYSHTEGHIACAYGPYSHAEGASAAYGAYSHAEGGGQAHGSYSHAEGGGTTHGGSSHAEGDSTTTGWRGYALSASIAAGVIKLLPIYGDRTTDFQAGSFVLIQDPQGEIVAGVTNTYRYEISGSAFTSSLTQITLYDTSVTTATTKQIIGVYGNSNPTSADVECGEGSHAEGYATTAYGNYSHAAGFGTQTVGWYQSVVGMGNKPISDRGAFIVGDGDPDNSIQHNLLVAAAGSVVISGSLQVSGSLIVSPTSSGTPAYTGKDGEIVFGQTGANYKIYVWLGGAWRSGSLS
jgi:hypothetical protein